MLTYEEIEIENIDELLNIRISAILYNGEYTGYMITSTGNVYKRTKKKLKQCKKTTFNTGYNGIYIKGKTYLLHRLVAMAFIPNPENKEQVNHIDGVKTNNDISNLEWCTPQENMIHSYKTGLHKVGFGENSNNPKVNNKIVKKICKLLEENELTLDEIAKCANTTKLIVYNIKHKITWTNISKYYDVSNHTKRSDNTMRLTEDIVRSICHDLEMNEFTIREIANRYNISYSAVSEIKQKKTWRHVSKDYNIENHDIRPRTNKHERKQVSNICTYLQDTDMSVSEISKTLEVSTEFVYRVMYGYSYKSISSNYNFSKRFKK